MQEFVSLVANHLGVLPAVNEADYARKPSRYIGGEYRTFLETPDTNILLAYESCPWDHELMPAYAVMHHMFGSATGFSVGGPGKGMLSRAYSDVLRKKYYIHECETMNLHFSDCGLFGLNFTGSSANAKDMLHDMLEVINNFRGNISEQELRRTKNILKRNILLNMSNQCDRLEEMARSVILFILILF